MRTPENKPLLSKAKDLFIAGVTLFLFLLIGAFIYVADKNFDHRRQACQQACEAEGFDGPVFLSNDEQCWCAKSKTWKPGDPR